MKRKFYSFLILLGVAIISLYTVSCSRSGSKQISYTARFDSLLTDSVVVNSIVDSLRAELLNTANDSTAICLILQLGDEWKNPDYGIMHEQLASLAQKKKSEWSDVMTDYSSGLLYFRKTKWDSAEYFFRKATTIFHKIQNREKYVSSVFYTAEIYRMTGKYDSSLAIYDRAIREGEQIHLDSRLAYAYACKADIFRIMGQRDAADSLLKMCKSNTKGFSNYQVSMFYNIVKAGLFRSVSNYDSAVVYYNKVLKIANEMNDFKRISFCYISLGDILKLKNDYSGAIASYSKGVKILRISGNKYQEALVITSIGTIYLHLSEFEKCIEKCSEGLKLAYEVKDKNRQCLAYCYMAQAAGHINRAEDGLIWTDSVLKISRGMKDLNVEGFCYDVRGGLWTRLNQPDSAIFSFERAIEIGQQLKDPNRQLSGMIALSEIYRQKNNLTAEKKYASAGFELAKQMNTAENLSKAALTLYRVKEAEGNYKDALDLYVLHRKMQDTVKSEGQIRKFAGAEFQMKEALLKAEQEKEQQAHKLENERNQSELKRQKLVGWGIGTVLFLVALFSTFIYRSLRLNKKQNKIILDQRNELEKEKNISEKRREEVEEKQKEIIDSILYAQRIQKALLPADKLIQRNLEKLRNKTKQ